MSGKPSWHEAPADAAQPQWTRRPERGCMAVLRLMSWISLRLGRQAGRLVLLGIAAYYLLFAPSARRASRAYLRLALGREPGIGDLYRHFFSFAATIHDRIYLLNDRFDLFDISVHGETALSQCRAGGQGVFLMGAHLGSFEVIRAIGRKRPELRVAMAMYEANARKLNAMLAAINPAAQQDIIPLGQVDSMMRVRDCLEAGALVGILGDRSLGGERVARIPLLGAEAPLPVAAFRLAAVLRQPVIFMVGLYRGGNRYEVHFEALADFSHTAAAERNAAIEAAMNRYAGILERYCRSAPYNWFNFFDFWQAYAMPAAGTES